MSSPDLCTQLGYELGLAAALNFATVGMLENELTFDSAIYASCSFETSSRNVQYDALMKPLTSKGMANQTCFFLLSEILMQINSIGAL